MKRVNISIFVHISIENLTLYLVGSMLALIAALCVSVAHFPTFKYFVIQDEYTEIDIKETIVQECFEYGRNVTSLFLDDFSGPHPITLLHAWHKSNEKGDFYACEVLRMKVRYLVTVNVVNDAKYLYSVRILNEETASGAHWFQPSEDAVEMVMTAVKAKFGDDVELGNVAVFKTVMNMGTIGQMVLDCTKGDERMLLNVKIVKKFGAKEAVVEEVEKIY